MADEKPNVAFDGSPMPNKPLPIRKVDYDRLTGSITKLESKTLTAKGLIYGDSGTMKTTKAMEILQKITPPDKKILYVDTAEGWSVLMNYPHLRERVIHMPYQGIESLWALSDLVLAKTPPYDSIGAILFDEYTQMHDEDLNWIVQSRSDQKAKDNEFKDPYQPALPDYNAARIRSNRTLAKFMKLPETHLLFIGHEKKDKGWTLPDMPDKAGKSLYVKLHFVFHAEWDVKGDRSTWRAQTSGGNKVIAKNRVSGVGSFMTETDTFAKAYLSWGTPAQVTTEPEPIQNDHDDDDLMKLIGE